MNTRSAEPPDGPTRRPASSASVALFLSLSLLLLAFFIVLNALSTTEATRIHAVMGSLSRTFSDGRLHEGTAFTGVTGAVVATVRPFEAELAEMVATAVPAARVRQAVASRLTEVTMRADALFEVSGPALRAPRRELLDRLVAAFSAAPPGVALAMEFTLGTDYDSSSADGRGNRRQVGQDAGAALVDLQRARAAVMAQALLARGMPPAAFAVGLEHGLGEQARLRFRVLDIAVPAGDGQG